VVAQERPFPGATVEEVAQLRGERFVVGAVSAVGPEVVQQHGDERDEEEGRVDVGHEVGLVVGGVCEYCLGMLVFCESFGGLGPGGCCDVRWLGNWTLSRGTQLPAAARFRLRAGPCCVASSPRPTR
jgi:hypothetical protein